MNTNREKILEFRRIINSALLDEIDGDYALLDVPNHGNIGDNLIWEGEVQFLKNNKNNCIYSANVLNWDERKIQETGVILFHGGGNWGDLYRVCQELRLYVISKYHNKKIIVFPQTAWYNDESLLLSDCEIVNDHPNIIVCLRDQASYELLSKYIDTKKLRLIPDMAFFVDIKGTDCKKPRTLYLARTDTEKKENQIIPNGADVSDWPTYINNKYLYFVWHLFFEKKNLLSIKLQKSKLTSWMVDSEYGLNRRNGRERL